MNSFMGLPKADIATLAADIALLGIPAATPYPGAGAFCGDAPAAIRTAMAPKAATLHHHDFDFDAPLLEGLPARAVDCGDLPFDPTNLPANRTRIRDAITTIRSHNAVPIIIGGDDSIQIPLFEAFAGGGPYTLLQIDAHIDWRDDVNGERHGLSSTMRRAAEQPHITRMIQVGARATGSARPSDVADARAWGSQIITARALHRSGIDPILDLIPTNANVLIAFDCDALDPSIMPAVSALSPGGLTYWQTLDLLHGVANKARIANFNLVEFMPSRDPTGTAALLAGRILANVIGLVARQAK